MNSTIRHLFVSVIPQSIDSSLGMQATRKFNVPGYQNQIISSVHPYRSSRPVKKRLHQEIKHHQSVLPSLKPIVSLALRISHHGIQKRLCFP